MRSCTSLLVSNAAGTLLTACCRQQSPAALLPPQLPAALEASRRPACLLAAGCGPGIGRAPGPRRQSRQGAGVAGGGSRGAAPRPRQPHAAAVGACCVRHTTFPADSNCIICHNGGCMFMWPRAAEGLPPRDWPARPAGPHRAAAARSRWACSASGTGSTCSTPSPGTTCAPSAAAAGTRRAASRSPSSTPWTRWWWGPAAAH
jgi:hypothetical protein